MDNKIQQFIQSIQYKTTETVEKLKGTEKSALQEKASSIGVEVFRAVKSEAQKLSHQFSQIFSSSKETKVGNQILTPPKAPVSSPSSQDLFVGQLTKKVSQFFDRAGEPKNPQQLKGEVDRQLNKLYSDYPTLDKNYRAPPGTKLAYVTPEVKEKFMMLQALKERIEKNPKAIAEDMWIFGKEPIYKDLGAVKFLSIRAVIDQNIEKMGGEKALTKEERKLSDLERVAMFAYTTGKYKEVNPATRSAQGQKLDDVGLADMQGHVDGTLEKLPHFKGASVGRAIEVPEGVNPDDFVESIFGKPTTKDFAYYSTSLDSKVSSDINVTILPPEGSKVFPHGHEVPAFLTAWGGEKEVLFKRGVKFEVVGKTKAADGKSWNVTLRCLPDKSVEPKSSLRSRYQSWRQSQFI